MRSSSDNCPGQLCCLTASALTCRWGGEDLPPTHQGNTSVHAGILLLFHFPLPCLHLLLPRSQKYLNIIFPGNVAAAAVPEDTEISLDPFAACSHCVKTPQTDMVLQECCLRPVSGSAATTVLPGQKLQYILELFVPVSLNIYNTLNILAYSYARHVVGFSGDLRHDRRSFKVQLNLQTVF